MNFMQQSNNSRVTRGDAAIADSSNLRRLPRVATLNTSQIPKQNKAPSNLCRKNNLQRQQRIVEKENSHVHADQRINQGIRPKQNNLLVGQKRRALTAKNKPDRPVTTVSSIPTRRNFVKKAAEKYETKFGLVDGDDEVAKNNLAQKLASSESSAFSEQYLTATTQRQSVCTSKTIAETEVAADQTRSSIQTQRDESKEQSQKRQRVKATSSSSNEGLESVSSMAQKFIPQWIQSISTSIADTFNHLHENINFISNSSSSEAQQHNRITLDPQIPDGQRLLTLGFQKTSTKATSKKGSAGFGIGSGLNSKNKENNLISLGFQDQEELIQDGQIQIKCIPEEERQQRGHDEIIYNSEVRNVRHSDCDDLLELQLQQKSTSLLKKRDWSNLLPSKKFSDESSTNLVQFPVYMDSSLSFLDRDTDIGRQVSKSIVAADFDDDCMTDDDMKDNAQKAMIRELTKGIDKYLTFKKQGNEARFIQNRQLAQAQSNRLNLQGLKKYSFDSDLS